MGGVKDEISLQKLISEELGKKVPDLVQTFYANVLWLVSLMMQLDML